MPSALVAQDLQRAQYPHGVALTLRGAVVITAVSFAKLYASRRGVHSP